MSKELLFGKTLDTLALKYILPRNSYAKIQRRTGIPLTTIRNMFYGRALMTMRVLKEAYDIIEANHRLIERENKKIQRLNKKNKEICGTQ